MKEIQEFTWYKGGRSPKMNMMKDPVVSLFCTLKLISFAMSLSPVSGSSTVFTVETHRGKVGFLYTDVC